LEDLDIILRIILTKFVILSIGLYGAEAWTHSKINQEYLGSFEVWYWRRMEKISWTDRVKNEVLRIVKEVRSILHTVK
jgi:hypothetical protein